MKITLESPNLTDYLERTSIIDFDNDEIQNLAKE
ncbi:MAG: ABC transporter ATP-binding protein, partial [Epulopiscium sp.]|nr:ABC transporter ATP-binding protein [Candidatus Epulonipiscium sp.]